LSGHLVDLHDVLGPDGARLGDVAREMPSWQQRFDRIDRFLLDRLENGRAASSRLDWRRNAPHGLCDSNGCYNGSITNGHPAGDAGR
jgi:hypothetical protein